VQRSASITAKLAASVYVMVWVASLSTYNLNIGAGGGPNWQRMDPAGR
jgi:hypothetical protein